MREHSSSIAACCEVSSVYVLWQLQGGRIMQVVDNEQLSKSAFVTVKFHQASPVPVWQLFATRKALRVEQRSGYSSYEMVILRKEALAFIVGSHSTSAGSWRGNFCAILALVCCLQKRNTFTLYAKAALEAGGAAHSH